VVEPATLRPWTILLVVDSPSIRSLATQFLARDGAIVITEDSDRAALEVGQRYGGVIDLLVADVQMTRQDGITLAFEFRTFRPSIPVLLLAGFWNPRLEVLRQFGMCCLLKPFSERQLLRAVGGLLAPDASTPHGANLV
jgi:DNA-binding response OmpR family regulator